MPIQASVGAAELLRSYDELLKEIYEARQAFARLSQILVNPVTVKFLADAPAGYGTTWDMSKIRLPDLGRLGNAIYEWQTIRAQLIKMLADPTTDEQTRLYLDSKLHVRIVSC